MLFPALYKHSRRKNRTVCEALEQNKWIADVDYSLTPGLITEFVSLWMMLDGTTLSHDREDRIVWLHTSDGQYSAKSAYKLHFHGLTASATATLTWKTKAPPKCRFFCWLLLQNRIWTAARLQLRHWPNEYFCQLCLRNLETASHLFLECPVTKTIWHRVAEKIHAPCLSPANWDSGSELNEWCLLMLERSPVATRAGTASFIMLVFWEIWRE